MKAAIDSLVRTAHRPVAALRGWLPWGAGEGAPGKLRRSPRPVEPFDIGDRPTIGLALSAGGAKGLAHVGVIQVLEENGIQIDAVAGTSMGAYVAAMWASGLDGEQLEELAATVREKRDLWSLVDPVLFPRRGFIYGTKIERRLRTTLDNRTFREMVRPLYVMVTEFEGFRRRVIHEGDVASAVLASIAIPGIVVPVMRDGVEYVDGGVCDPLPVAVLREMAGVDHIIAVNVLPTVEEFHQSRKVQPELSDLPIWKRILIWLSKQINWFARGNILDTLRSAAMASQMRVVEHSAELADVTIRPVDHAARWHDYTSYRRYIDVGREAALKALPEILRMVKSGNGKSPNARSE